MTYKITGNRSKKYRIKNMLCYVILRARNHSKRRMTIPNEFVQLYELFRQQLPATKIIYKAIYLSLLLLIVFNREMIKTKNKMDRNKTKYQFEDEDSLPDQLYLICVDRRKGDVIPLQKLLKLGL